MNTQPHVHDIEIQHHNHYWRVTYGDQTAYVQRPWFLKNTRGPKRLRRTAIKLIRKHDRISKDVETSQARLVAAMPQFTRKDQWGSDQL